MATTPASHVASPVVAESAAREPNTTFRPEPVAPRPRSSTLAASAQALLQPGHCPDENAPSAKSTAPRVSPRIARKRSSPFVAPDLNRHARKCQICRHPQRKSIEADFLDWRYASWIRTNYGISSDKAIYNHARATGLDVRRRDNIRLAAEKILERVDEIGTPSAMDIIRAVRTLACINERNQWVEPPKTRVIVYHTERAANISMPESPESPRPELSSRNSQPQVGSVSSSPLPLSQTAVACSSPITCHSPLPSNRQTPPQLESDVTGTKQTPATVSNRPKERIFSSELPLRRGENQRVKING